MYRAATEDEQQKQGPEEDDISESWLKEAAAREPDRARDRERGSGPGGGGGAAEELDPARRRGKLRNGIEWCRRHLRFLGPGLIASAA